MISQQGEAAATADSLQQGQEVVVNSLQQRFADQSNVNIDEEMANLLKLQTAYGANARVLSTVRDMLDMLLQVVRQSMNVTGVGARSSLVVQTLGDMRTQLGDLQRQLGTGKKSTTYAGLGIDRGLAVGLRGKLSAIASYADTVDAARRADQPAADRADAASPISARR